MMINDALDNKRKKILEKIKPVCEAFGISEYDYVIDEKYNAETLIISGQRIACTMNSEDAILDELIGYLFVKRFCRHRSSIVPASAMNAVKRYWI